jgi:hypothetical protein
MLKRTTGMLKFAALAMILAAGVSGGIAAGRTPVPQATVTLVYKFVPGTPLSYKMSSGQTQNLEVMGQSMTTENTSGMDITLKPKGLKDGNHILGVTVDDMATNIQSPQGSIVPDLSGIIGKSFDIVLSPLGKEVDVSGASAFTVDMGMAGRRDLSSSFQGLFPDLPDHAVKVGDTWPSEDTIVQKSDSGDIHIAFKNENALEGFETIDGRECARIKTAFDARMTGALSQGGMSVSLDAKLTGIQTWYFAVKDGIFVKSESKGATNGTLSAEAMNMTIGFTGEQRSAGALVKK